MQAANIGRRPTLDSVKCQLNTGIGLQIGPADEETNCNLTFEFVYMLLQGLLLCMQLRLLLYAVPALLCGGCTPDSLDTKADFQLHGFSSRAVGVTPCRVSSRS